MRKLHIYIFIGLIFLIWGSGAVFSNSSSEQSKMRDRDNEYELLASIEKGTLDAEIFINYVKSGNYLLEKISHFAIANYMEALANEGMLKLIPINNYRYDDINTALDVVFEDRTNSMVNWDVFKNQWLTSQMCQ